MEASPKAAYTTCKYALMLLIVGSFSLSGHYCILRRVHEELSVCMHLLRVWTMTFEEEACNSAYKSLHNHSLDKWQFRVRLTVFVCVEWSTAKPWVAHMRLPGKESIKNLKTKTLSDFLPTTGSEHLFWMKDKPIILLFSIAWQKEICRLFFAFMFEDIVRPNKEWR